jgi:hypothetical protein
MPPVFKARYSRVLLVVSIAAVLATAIVASATVAVKIHRLLSVLIISPQIPSDQPLVPEQALLHLREVSAEHAEWNYIDTRIEVEFSESVREYESWIELQKLIADAQWDRDKQFLVTQAFREMGHFTQISVQYHDWLRDGLREGRWHGDAKEAAAEALVAIEHARANPDKHLDFSNPWDP